MTAFQWFLIGGMAAWTPAFIALAIMLWRAADGPEES